MCDLKAVSEARYLRLRRFSSKDLSLKQAVSYAETLFFNRPPVPISIADRSLPHGASRV
ncbi:hypothetical protein XAP412_120012 [Xanthomonas phaseoli pv. phaseoli]|uniref:Transposase n=1 Tax=Xanthomonas campestris pv. phaseoli TaxID=317013 RepID=A0AB38DUS1_XANCH|nr:hypothetical protein XAP7430_100058 [Xanthomonas phaseoli pv. phaseoli]SON77171.1 hypothetical protein XAP412_120012 [Xanthomonas phaseoli pv. phaseoli]SON77973.1 hypothetical protein XAP6984_160012 [Xanthomonas phaseoli pv. phaseoli]